MALLYSECGCRNESKHVGNYVCRNADCIDYGTHRRGMEGDRCNWCGVPYVRLSADLLKGAR